MLVRARYLPLVSLLAIGACDAVPDVRFTDDGGPDSTTAANDASVKDGGAPIDGGGAADATTCDLTGLPPNASCCDASPCIGLACGECVDCEKAACHAGQVCCAHVNPQGTYLGTQCTAMAAGCP